MIDLKHMFLVFRLAKIAKSKPLKSKTIWVTWMEIIMDMCMTFSRLGNTHLQHFLLTWLELKRDPSICLTLVLVWNFELSHRWKMWVTFLSWKDPLTWPNSYAQSEFWTFSWMKRMFMIFWSFKMTYPLHFPNSSSRWEFWTFSQVESMYWNTKRIVLLSLKK
jgi:hypothetical protein